MRAFIFLRNQKEDNSRRVHDLEIENDIISIFSDSVETSSEKVKTTGLVHPCGVGRDAGEDGGLLVRIAPHTRHKASYAMDVVMVID